MSMTTSPIGLNEAVESLTGYEEQEIADRFGSQIEGLLEHRPTVGMRAVAYVLISRDLQAADVKDPKGKAYKQVMEMTMKQAAGFWPDDDEGDDGSDDLGLGLPATPAGEGGDSAD